MNTTFYKWNNVTSSFAGSLMGFANENLNYLSGYDTAHAFQLRQIRDALQGLQLHFFNSIEYTYISNAERVILAPFYSLANKILYAYWNFLKDTSAGGISGPPFWYSGPSPPDEQLLQDAVNIALALPTPM